MARDFVNSRHLAYRLLIRSLRSEYRAMIAGLFLGGHRSDCGPGGFLFLSKQNVFRTVETTTPYGLYLFVGILLWQIFTDSYQRPIQWLWTYRLVMGQVNFPREALILGALCEVLIRPGIRVSMVLFVLLWLGREIGATFLFAPLAIFMLIGLGLVVGLILAPVGSCLRVGTFRKRHELGHGVLVYDDAGGLSAAYRLAGFLTDGVNPVTPLVVTARELVFGTGLTQLSPFLVVSPRDRYALGRLVAS